MTIRLMIVKQTNVDEGRLTDKYGLNEIPVYKGIEQI